MFSVVVYVDYLYVCVYVCIYHYIYCHTYVYRVFGLKTFPFKEWFLVNLDFSLLNISLCNDNQYTTWVPTDEVLILHNNLHTGV